MTIGELRQQLADADDEMEVVVARDKPSRFHSPLVGQVEIDISQPDVGYREADIFTRSLHRKKVILIG